MLRDIPDVFALCLKLGAFQFKHYPDAGTRRKMWHPQNRRRDEHPAIVPLDA